MGSYGFLSGFHLAVFDTLLDTDLEFFDALLLLGKDRGEAERQEQKNEGPSDQMHVGWLKCQNKVALKLT